MSLPRLVALATDTPPTRYTQKQILDYFLSVRQDSNRKERAIRTVFDRSGVAYRHTVVKDGYFNRERTTQERNTFYMEEALPLGEAAIRRGLQTAGYEPDEIDHFIVVSCTGFDTPGLDLHLARQLQMRPDLRRTCILGMGCYAAFPGLKCAYDAVRGQPDQLALVLTLELCSLHMQSDDSTETVVSSALFSDGASIALVGSDAGRMFEGPHIIGSATACDYNTLDHMAFTLTDHGFRMYLSSYVPQLLSGQITPFVDRLLGKHGLRLEDIRLWGIHPGSTRIIDYVQSQLKLTDEQVEASHQVLHDYGNMSSATILFVLEQIIKCQHPQPGDHGVLLAFGPGLTMEGLLLQW